VCGLVVVCPAHSTVQSRPLKCPARSGAFQHDTMLVPGAPLNYIHLLLSVVMTTEALAECAYVGPALSLHGMKLS
jgi:hypothetical protein